MLLISGNALAAEARFGAFTTRCHTDPITDARRCIARQGPLAIIVEDNRTWGVIIGSDHSQNSNITLRFDKTTPITAPAPGWIGTDASTLIDRMHRHRNAAMRYRHAADNLERTAIIDLAGLPEAAAWLAKNSRR